MLPVQHIHVVQPHQQVIGAEFCCTFQQKAGFVQLAVLHGDSGEQAHALDVLRVAAQVVPAECLRALQSTLVQHALAAEDLCRQLGQCLRLNHRLACQLLPARVVSCQPRDGLPAGQQGGVACYRIAIGRQGRRGLLQCEQIVAALLIQTSMAGIEALEFLERCQCLRMFAEIAARRSQQVKRLTRGAIGNSRGGRLFCSLEIAALQAGFCRLNAHP